MQWAPGKKSIFSISDGYDEADLDAPDVDNMGEDEEEVVKKPSFFNTFFVGQGNNPTLPKMAMVDRGYRMLAKGMLFSNDFRLKWVQTSMEVNYMHFKEGTHLCNHISNATKILTNKIATHQALEDLQLNLTNGVLKSSVYSNISEFFPATYRLDMVADLYQFLNCGVNGLWLEKKSQSN